MGLTQTVLQKWSEGFNDQEIVPQNVQDPYGSGIKNVIQFEKYCMSRNAVRKLGFGKSILPSLLSLANYQPVLFLSKKLAACVISWWNLNIILQFLPLETFLRIVIGAQERGNKKEANVQLSRFFSQSEKIGKEGKIAWEGCSATDEN